MNEIVKAAVLHEFELAANARRRLADENDDECDGHNEVYAVSLERVLDHIRALPVDTPVFARLFSCAALHEEFGCFAIPLEQNEHTIHFGPRNRSLAPDECAPWLDNWVDHLIRDAEKMAAH